MARITVEDCLKKLPNRFALVSLASARTKQLYKGSHPRVQADNKEVVLALREVAAGKVTPARPLKEDLPLQAKAPKELKP
ncbi:MAG TPA: DNA-directed RNA polymerase subunit omega [Thermodesulfobacteriota bacterium]|jgi:DNA-directed RNA polymerase subunit omega